MRYSATMLNIERIRAISLDLDDTLWPIAPTIRRAEMSVQHWLRLNAPRTAQLLAEPGAMPRIRSEVLARANEGPKPWSHDMSALRLESTRQALLEAGDDGAKAEAAFEVFFAERQRVELYDDALEALIFLSQRYPILALSNGNADLHRIGLGSYFTASLSARELGLAKPDPRAFQAVAQRAGVDPAAVLHIGDDAELDTLGSLQVGMQAIWLNRAGADWIHAPRPQAVVRDLRQLCALWPSTDAVEHL